MLIIREKFKDPDVEAVKIDCADKFRERLSNHYNLLTHLHDFTPVIFGGSLRDAFAGVEPNDFDVCLRFKEDNFKVRQLPYDFIGVPDTLHPHTADSFSLWFKERGIALESDPMEKIYQHISMISFEGSALGLKCDFVLADTFHDETAQLAMYGDAPINCVAMDSSGDIWAHPDFEADLANQSYRLRVEGEEAQERAEQRVAKMHSRYPDLTSELF